MENTPWPGGVSDGLSIPCSRCGIHPKFDYVVLDDAWRECVPKEWRAGVICLPCLDILASQAGVSICRAIKEVQFTGDRYTIVLKPNMVVWYGDKTAREAIEPDYETARRVDERFPDTHGEPAEAPGPSEVERLRGLLDMVLGSWECYCPDLDPELGGMCVWCQVRAALAPPIETADTPSEEDDR